ncbi:MAG: tetratricopeptide repeat protein [Nitrospira sp.]|nr:tetratricopeptide repeat protein [Nitrospira sp.]
MKSSRLVWTQLILALLVWCVERSLAFGESPTAQPAASSTILPSAAGQPEQIELPGQPLPDDGPRLEGHSQGMDSLALQEGISAYKKEDWTQARRHFEKVLAQQPSSSLAPSALAFLAESFLLEGASNTHRLNAINQYKTLVLEYPQSDNALRAEWRIADLYLQQAWYHEAQSMYERAMAHSPNTPDGHRALLGLGYTFLALKKWTEAGQAFENVRKQSRYEQVLMPATVGLAHSLFRQRRFRDARVLYDLSYRRWPAAVRIDPMVLQRYAAIEMDAQHGGLGRELLLQFYNVIPRHPDAPGALLRLADSLLASDHRPSAELFLDFVAGHYRGSEAGDLAQVRLAALVSERLHQAGGQRLGLNVFETIHHGSEEGFAALDFETRMRAVAKQYDRHAIGSEALLYLARYHERRDEIPQALSVYKEIVERGERAPEDPWPITASRRLATLLQPWMEAAARSQDDVTLISLFQRHGPAGERHYLASPLLLTIADAHRRLGFIGEAGRLYQALVKANKLPALTEEALVSLGKTYLDQHDPAAARGVLERARLQFPDGRFQSEGLRLLVTAMMEEQDTAGLLHFCRQWILRHPRHPERPWMYQQLAAVLLQMKKPDEAVLAVEEAFKAGAPKSVAALMAYADLLSQLKRHEQANEVYHTVIEKKPSPAQIDWARLQIARGWRALKQYDRATVALAELGQSEDQLLTRFSAHYYDVIRQARQQPKEEGL